MKCLTVLGVRHGGEGVCVPSGTHLFAGPVCVEEKQEQDCGERHHAGRSRETWKPIRKHRPGLRWRRLMSVRSGDQ